MSDGVGDAAEYSLQAPHSSVPHDDQIDALVLRDRHDLGRGIAGAYVGRGGKPLLPSE